MKVKLKPITSYEVIALSGKSLGIFQDDGRWHGMLSLKRADSKVLIVEAPSGTEELLAGGLGKLCTDLAAIEVDIVKVSPSLVEELPPQGLTS